MTAVYKNRYGDYRYFHDDGNGQIWMTGNILSMRYGGNVENSSISYCDADGGPYIEIGDDLQFLYKDGKSRVVEKIEGGEILKLWYKMQ